MKKSKLGKEIEAVYYRHATGTWINVMDIPKLFDDVGKEVAAGKPLEPSVIEAIARYKV